MVAARYSPARPSCGRRRVGHLGRQTGKPGLAGRHWLTWETQRDPLACGMSVARNDASAPFLAASVCAPYGSGGLGWCPRPILHGSSSSADGGGGSISATPNGCAPAECRNETTSSAAAKRLCADPPLGGDIWENRGRDLDCSAAVPPNRRAWVRASGAAVGQARLSGRVTWTPLGSPVRHRP
jgi:hypothetical protein